MGVVCTCGWGWNPSQPHPNIKKDVEGKRILPSFFFRMRYDPQPHLFFLYRYMDGKRVGDSLSVWLFPIPIPFSLSASGSLFPIASKDTMKSRVASCSIRFVFLYLSMRTLEEKRRRRKDILERIQSHPDVVLARIKTTHRIDDATTLRNGCVREKTNMASSFSFYVHERGFFVRSSREIYPIRSKEKKTRSLDHHRSSKDAFSKDVSTFVTCSIAFSTILFFRIFFPSRIRVLRLASTFENGVKKKSIFRFGNSVDSKSRDRRGRSSIEDVRRVRVRWT